MPKTEYFQKATIRPDGHPGYTTRQFTDRRKRNLFILKSLPDRVILITEEEQRRRFPNLSQGT